MLGELDNDVKEYLRQWRVVGGVINNDVVMAAARGIVQSKNHSLLEHEGSISIEKSWAKSLLIRMNFVKCKGSSAEKIPPSEFEALKQSYLERITVAALEHKILPQMIINMNQTGIHLIQVHHG